MIKGCESRSPCHWPSFPSSAWERFFEASLLPSFPSSAWERTIFEAPLLFKRLAHVEISLPHVRRRPSILFDKHDRRLAARVLQTGNRPDRPRFLALSTNQSRLLVIWICHHGES